MKLLRKSCGAAEATVPADLAMDPMQATFAPRHVFPMRSIALFLSPGPLVPQVLQNAKHIKASLVLTSKAAHDSFYSTL